MGRRALARSAPRVRAPMGGRIGRALAAMGARANTQPRARGGDEGTPPPSGTGWWLVVTGEREPIEVPEVAIIRPWGEAVRLDDAHEVDRLATVWRRGWQAWPMTVHRRWRA